MFEYEMSQTRSAGLRRQADQWRMADVAAKAARELQRSERRVLRSSGGRPPVPPREARGLGIVGQALRAVRPRSAV
jgi:hypothetical protein